MDSEAPINNSLLLDNLSIRISACEWKLDSTNDMVKREFEKNDKFQANTEKSICELNKKLDKIIEQNEIAKKKRWTDIVQVITLVIIMVLGFILGV